MPKSSNALELSDAIMAADADASFRVLRSLCHNSSNVLVLQQIDNKLNQW
jgi:hypothetical protein